MKTILVSSRTLHAACEKGDMVSLMHHLENGGKVNERKANGYFPLGAASNKGHTSIVKILLENGARINMKSKYGWTPLYIAANRGYTNVVDVLLQYSPLLNTTTISGWNSPNKYTPLHIACKKGYYEIVKLLIGSGAKINPKNGDNETPIDLAILHRRYKIACYLALQGGKPAVQKHFV
ncbi:MAG: ankyrin repeat domain-containing protein [Crenarchaeota archaeon]|nr:ankyrin repeat domain-containing protein [Thermoproteota archaeon]